MIYGDVIVFTCIAHTLRLNFFLLTALEQKLWPFMEFISHLGHFTYIWTKYLVRLLGYPHLDTPEVRNLSELLLIENPYFATVA